MKRSQLEHLIRAAADIADDDELVIIGSQAILGQYPRAPAELIASMDVDMYPKNKPERADLIDGSIGELSPFHDAYGYYAHGVGRETAILPQDWQERLVPIRGKNTRGATGWCLEIHDLLVSKAVAGREKDLRFLEGVARHRLANLSTLRERLAAVADLPSDAMSRILIRLESVFAEG